MVTWKEFKDAIEKAGVKDDEVIAYMFVNDEEYDDGHWLMVGLNGYELELDMK